MTTLALAAPTRAQLDDVENWVKKQDAFLAGPKGCWVLVGDVKQTARFHQPPDWFSAPRNEVYPMVGTIEGRLDNGRWDKALTQKMAPDGHELNLEVPVYPLFGAMPKSERKRGQVSVSVGDGEPQVAGSLGSSVNILREAVDRWSGSFESALTQWDADQGAVLLLREIALSDDDPRPIEVTVRYPDGQRADRVDAVWPRRIVLGDWPIRLKIRDARMHAIGHVAPNGVFPWAESLSFSASALGYTVGFEQEVAWRTATPCAAAD